MVCRPFGTKPSSDQKTTIFIPENAIEDVVCEMAAILYRPQWIKLAGIDLVLSIVILSEWILST